MSQYIHVPIYSCSNIFMSQYTHIPIYSCPNILMSQWTHVPIYLCPNVLMSQYTHSKPLAGSYEQGIYFVIYEELKERKDIYMLFSDTLRETSYIPST